ncbi:MAG: hypothetical protein AABY18_04115 [Candidatus Thermoplasmatota archaeon]
MSKLLLSALVLAVVFAPSAVAQAQTVTIEILDLAPSGLTNGTSLIEEFKVHATISNAPACISQAQGSSYTFDLTAIVSNSTGNSTTAQVNPRQITIAGPVLLPPIVDASAERTEDVTLVVNAGPYSGDALNTTVKVVASFAGGNGGCTGATAAAADSAEAEFQANFLPVRGFGTTETSGNELPGPAFTFTLLALVGIAAIVRRNR